jgi:hypothetical protein
LSFWAFKLRILKAQDFAVLFDRALHVIVEPGGSFGLNFNGDPDFDAGAGRELQDDLIHQSANCFVSARARQDVLPTRLPRFIY